MRQGNPKIPINFLLCWLKYTRTSLQWPLVPLKIKFIETKEYGG